ncbi:hypothetical protein AURDEDRAFT_131854 [Auricularia subglabra TFB-10046 SS5]|uniref:Uncharacterized protein n=1 Tax=Auricularia subglabra (strain TFB-10046 / SS5) TaxID=717982 RepID=J0L9Q7_AURST|nr:hypothetical protein AURDEDRAFT_131854 [Auricularia subglabra TFB-10046 SS5]
MSPGDAARRIGSRKRESWGQPLRCLLEQQHWEAERVTIGADVATYPRASTSGWWWLLWVHERTRQRRDSEDKCLVPDHVRQSALILYSVNSVRDLGTTKRGDKRKVQRVADDGRDAVRRHAPNVTSTTSLASTQTVPDEIPMTRNLQRLQTARVRQRTREMMRTPSTKPVSVVPAGCASKLEVPSQFNLPIRRSCEDGLTI